VPRLLLASASPARLATLQRAGVEPIVRTSNVDEPATLRTAAAKYGSLSSTDEALILARAKASDVVDTRARERLSNQDGTPDELAPTVVLGCDSILEFGGASWGKPATVDEARERWLRMSGSSGVLHSGHWIIDEGRGYEVGATSSAEVHFASVSKHDIDRYLASGEPLRVAGAFTIDGLGGWFIDRIVGDHHGVVGVSLPLVRQLLADIDLNITDFWH